MHGNSKSLPSEKASSIFSENCSPYCCLKNACRLSLIIFDTVVFVLTIPYKSLQLFDNPDTTNPSTPFVGHISNWSRSYLKYYRALDISFAVKSSSQLPKLCIAPFTFPFHSLHSSTISRLFSPLFLVFNNFSRFFVSGIQPTSHRWHGGFWWRRELMCFPVPVRAYRRWGLHSTGRPLPVVLRC